MTKEISITSKGVEETARLAGEMGSRLRGDETIALDGELGAGKTHFVKGLVAGAGIDDIVTSPTFVLQRIYKGKGISINHYDAYRVGPDELEGIGIGDWLGKTVNVVEWGKRVSEAVPRDTIWIQLEYVDENTRKIKISYPEERAYLFD